uniref:anhydro-N-acetylmuramic acid kinase n=1 Tax=uncultured Agrococcus sp. TaxID=382258 RepID=UPI0025E6D361
RARDIAAGGHGAPLVPVLDALLLQDVRGVRSALNLGGISNATIIDDAKPPIAYDIGPANALIDAAVRMTDAHPDGYDAGGAIAASGRVDDALLEELLREPYYALAAPKSTGKELFNAAYVDEILERTARALVPQDLIATLTELTVRTVADELREHRVETVVASGGGARNATIMSGLRRELPDARVITTNDLGVDSDTKEAFAFALIGWLSWHGLPGAVASATGAREQRILGTITPGEDPLQLPQPLTEPPSQLRIVGAAGIREANADDLAGVVDVFYDCWTRSYPAVLPARLIDTVDRQEANAMWQRALADESGTVYVAESDDAIVGVVGFAMTDETQGHIRSLYVSPDEQGGGYGRRLVEAAIASLADRGACGVTLWVFEENGPSRRFYERLGWVADGERKVDPAFGEPQIRMTRSLK